VTLLYGESNFDESVKRPSSAPFIDTNNGTRSSINTAAPEIERVKKINKHVLP